MAKVKASKVRHYASEKLKPHHAKPFRKRHFLLLASSLSALVLLSYLFTSTSLANHKAIRAAKDLISSAVGSSKKSSPTTQVSSSYGFTLSYEQNTLYASAVSASSGKLYLGPELTTVRDYSAVRIGQSQTDPIASATSGSLDIEYHYSQPTGISTNLAKLEALLIGSQNPAFAIKESSDTTLSGVKFLQSDWASKSNGGVGSNFQSKLTSYVGVVNGAPLTILVNHGSGDNDSVQKSFQAILNSLKFDNPTQPLPPVSVEPQQASSLSLLDKLMMTKTASAANKSTAPEPSPSERISALYGASVVKIYNVYCMDIGLASQVFIRDVCNGFTGSGFFVGDGGYIATNGHVAVNNPLDIAITFAFSQAAKGDTSFFNSLAQSADLTQSDLDAGTTNQEQIRIAVEKFYKIPSSLLGAINKTENILVGLGEDQPDLQKLLDATKAGQLYPESNTLKQAKVVAYDYRAVDGADTGQFKASDVALLKIEGTNYPSTKLGNISSLAQGSGISVIGFPSAASTNKLVEVTKSRATLTSGKVSSIKSATGSNSQLIETDATIGHGNSGGPAFNDAGEVVGIATYTIDGSGDGNGVFNYIRDIADLTSLASKNSLDLAISGQTQQAWQKGVDYFYGAQYSKALKEFATVKALYPQHPRVDQLSALAQQKINAGEDITGYSLVLIGMLLALAILLVGAALYFIVSHHNKHKAYKQLADSPTSNPSLTSTPTQTNDQSL